MPMVKPRPQTLNIIGPKPCSFGLFNPRVQRPVDASKNYMIVTIAIHIMMTAVIMIHSSKTIIIAIIPFRAWEATDC